MQRLHCKGPIAEVLEVAVRENCLGVVFRGADFTATTFPPQVVPAPAFRQYRQTGSRECESGANLYTAPIANGLAMDHTVARAEKFRPLPRLDF